MVSEAFEEAGLLCYSKNFGLKQLHTYIQLLKGVITKAQEYEVSLKFEVYALLCVP